MNNQDEILIPSRRREETNKFWNQVADDLANDIPPEDISKKYINKRTGKPYTREHIYWVIRQLKKIQKVKQRFSIQ